MNGIINFLQYEIPNLLVQEDCSFIKYLKQIKIAMNWVENLKLIV